MSLMVCTAHQILRQVCKIKEYEMVRACIMHVGFCWENLNEGDHLEDLGLDGP
jgi:hypothetical protein